MWIDRYVLAAVYGWVEVDGIISSGERGGNAAKPGPLCFVVNGSF